MVQVSPRRRALLGVTADPGRLHFGDEALDDIQDTGGLALLLRDAGDDVFHIATDELKETHG